MNKKFNLPGAPNFTEYLKYMVNGGELLIRSPHVGIDWKPEQIDTQHAAYAWTIWLNGDELGTYEAAYIRPNVDTFDFTRRDFPRVYTGKIPEDTGETAKDKKKIYLEWHNSEIIGKDLKGIINFSTRTGDYRRLDQHPDVPFP